MSSQSTWPCTKALLGLVLVAFLAHDATASALPETDEAGILVVCDDEGQALEATYEPCADIREEPPAIAEVEGDLHGADPVTAGVRATEPVTAGEAYALLVEGDDGPYPPGTLVLFRGEPGLVAGSYEEVRDLSDTAYAGQLVTGVETSAQEPPWRFLRAYVRAFAVAPGHLIAPSALTAWFEDCRELSEVDLSALDLTNVRNADHLFAGCHALTRVEPGGLARARIESLKGCFAGCSSLPEADLTGWDLSRAASLESLFDGCTSLERASLAGVSLRRASSMRRTFADCCALRSVDLTGIDTRNVASFSETFGSCTSLAAIDLTDLDTGGATDLSSMFAGATALAGLDLTPLSLGTARTLAQMCAGCTSLTAFRAQGVDLSAAQDLSGLFDGCRALVDLDLSGLDSSAVTNLSCAFRDCTSLETLDLSGWELPRALNLTSMLEGCSSLTTCVLKDLRAPKARRLGALLRGCASLAELDLSSLDTGSARTLAHLFDGCQALRCVTLGPAFSFFGRQVASDLACALPEPPTEPPYTGLWVRTGSGEAMMGAELAQAYQQGGLAGTWSWQLGRHELTFDLAGGTLPEGVSYPHSFVEGTPRALPGCEDSALVAPTRSGHTFAGWVDDGGCCRTEVGTDDTTDVILHARWQPSQLVVTVPVKLDLQARAADETTLALAAKPGSLTITNESTTPVSVALSLGEGALVRDVVLNGDGGAPIALGREPTPLDATVAPAQTLVLGDLTALMDAADFAQGAQVGTLRYDLRPTGEVS